MTDDLKLADDLDALIRATAAYDVPAIRAAADALRTRHQPAEIARRAMREEAARVIDDTAAVFYRERNFDLAQHYRTLADAIRALPAALDVEAMVETGATALMDIDQDASFSTKARAVLFSIIGEGK